MLIQCIIAVFLTLPIAIVQAQILEDDLTGIAMDLNSPPDGLATVELPAVCNRNSQEVPATFYIIQSGNAVQVLLT